MMSYLLWHMVLLVFLSSRAVVLVKSSNNTISCGNDVNCKAVMKLMSIVTEINSKLEESASPPDEKSWDKLPANVLEMRNKQMKDMDILTESMNRSLASTAAISTQLERHSADLLSHDKRLRTHDLLLTNMHQLVQSMYWAEFGPQDCTDIRAMGFSISGVFRVYTRRIATDVYCDLKVPTESWLVFQRRFDGSQNFDRNWHEYAHGFGVLSGEFWIGNEKLSLLTMNKRYKLRIELEDFTGEKRWAEFSTFSVKPSSDKYRLIVAGYSGNAGDALTYHNNMMFSTKDVDNDLAGANCAATYIGGWWFNLCHHSNLNSLYLRGSHSRNAVGIYWWQWKGPLYSLKASEMKITAVQ